MFDLPMSIHPTTGVRGAPPGFPSGDIDPNPPFALTLSRCAPADLLSGRAAPLVLDRFATLAEAMQDAIQYAEGMTQDTEPQLLAILGRRLVSPSDQRGRGTRHGDRGEPAACAGGPRCCLG